MGLTPYTDTAHLESNTTDLFNKLPNTDRFTTGNFEILTKTSFGQYCACNVQGGFVTKKTITI